MDALHTSEIVGTLQEEASALPPKTELLPLDAVERVAVYRFGGKSYRHFFRRLTSGDAEAFFSSVTAEVTREKKGVMQSIDMDSAALALYGRAALRVEGFNTRDGRSARELPTWPECVPVNHRIIAGQILMSASGGGPEEFLDADGISVTLDAAWNEGEPGQMKVFTGLVHRFAAPTAEHHRKLLRARNRAFVVGGSRAGTTVIPSSHGVSLKLYDELIESVEGYGIAGAALAGREAIVREMDAFHKSAAIGQLFPFNKEIDLEDAGE